TMDEASFMSELRHLANMPHDLETGPLIDVRLFTRPEHASVVVLRAHVMLTDGMSFSMILRDLFQHYFGLAVPTDASAPGAQKFTYFDFARWHRKSIEGDDGKKAKAYWQKKLANLPAPLRVGDNSPESVDPHARGYYMQRYVGASENWDPRERARKIGVSMH